MKTPVKATNTTASASPPSVQCRQSSVRLRTRAVAPETRMMFNGAPPNFSVARRFESIAAALPAMVRAPQPFQRILRSDATLAGWAARREREEALAGIVRRHLPRPLALRVRVAEERNGQLELAADAGAVAAIVRQRSAELLTALKREGWEFTGIRVRVQVRVRPASLAGKPLANPLDRSALQPLSALARTLAVGAAQDRAGALPAAGG